MSEVHPEHPHETPPGQDPEWTPPGHGGTLPGQEDTPEEPDVPDPDAPQPEHPIVEPEPTPQEAAVEPRLSLAEFCTVVTLRPPAVATAAALASWMRRVQREPVGYLTVSEWQERYQAMLTSVP